MNKGFQSERISKHAEKEVTWANMAGKIDRVTDGFGEEIDLRIHEAVTAFNVFGIHTGASCEGHLDRGIAAPWIDMGARRDRDPAMVKRYKEAKEKRDLETEQRIMTEWEAQDMKEEMKLCAYLQEFYEGRNTNFLGRLIIEGGTNRLTSQGARYQEYMDPKIKEERLKEYREEMDALAEFLKRKFFEG